LLTRKNNHVLDRINLPDILCYMLSAARCHEIQKVMSKKLLDNLG
jgi:hypothetical protein